jgi:hypothetical protein
MSGFSSEWLRLREPIDAAARDASVAASLRRVTGAPLSIVDLGAGTGANLRYLAPLLGGAQQWLLVDHDQTLLAALPRALQSWAQANAAVFTSGGDEWTIAADRFDCRVRVRQVDLAAQLHAVPIAPGALVTSSALLDLVSEVWLRALAARCSIAKAQALFALTYDGRMQAAPADPDDALVRELCNAHQRTDKGFGPALGPAAAAAAAQAFAHHGYDVATCASDWEVPARERALQTALLGGWLDAALAIAPQHAARLQAWLRRRLEHIEHGRSTIRVGHVDLVARPA